ncbi:undecaprenyl-phosphate glucose phosphotransferase [Pararobbsia silviterrae]|uniref:Undecaprenyl-phosphate glucose phosphotransferase n=1 Tax=Pararobbsia silviterrae TaxID=1792498 RepID=A0A494XCM8_9BURK|nr:undecaprenyl-phosphate glucose phosphotransferase [Pararobbsia silviterrae]RKP45323.1 undecaprenyl-phosphate glucose phosphotransferase [Pararobbsia silviterrae]
MIGLTARATDVLIVALSALLAHWLRFGIGGVFAWNDADTLLVAFDCALVLIIFPACGVYQSWRGKSLSSLAWRIVGAWLVSTSVALMLLFSLHRSDISRLWFGTMTLCALVGLVGAKLLVYQLLRRVRRTGRNQRRVAVVGSESHSRTIINHLRDTPQAGFQPAMIYEPEDDETLVDLPRGEAATVSGIPVFHDFGGLVRKVRETHIDEIWLAVPMSNERLLLRFMREFRDDFVNLRFMPDTRSLSLYAHSLVEILGMPTINLAAAPVSDLEMWPKRVFDRFFALAVLLALLPVMIAIAIAVKLSSPGPVLFRQHRKGVDGHPFEILKFRTMRVHREAEGRLTQAGRADKRVTRVGAFLRRTSLDELPQFINVLLGQMSVVGPRPHAIEHDDLYKNLVDGYMFRYRIKPGITGWAQINGYRGETSRVEKMEARVKFDLFYIQNWSFWFDIKIVVMTLFKGFMSRNAY